jgi:transposase-like protein
VAVSGRQAETFSAGGRVCCNSCERWYTYRTGTPFQGSPADDGQIYLFALLTAADCPAAVIAEACRLSVDTIRAWQRRLVEVGGR